MARTNIKVFDEGYQNIMGDDDYNLSVQRTRGVTPGIADPLLHNKLYRQTSIMAKALADYIVSQGQDCLDTDLNAITNAFTKALETHTRKNTGVLVTESKTAANTADWNTLTESRTYKISGATFAADKHQPVGAIGTGELVVLKNGDDTIVQVYYANSTEFDKAGAYHRVNVGGAWTDWVYNITNKGGTVTGDFNINGKLAVDSIEVSDSLTIGGAKPLGKDAIDKLQAQIIAPIQNIYVDQKNGDDSNDGTTLLTAVRTLDKAVSLIKPYVKTTVINLKVYEEDYNEQYNTFGINKPIYGGNTTLIDGNIGKIITSLTIKATYTSSKKTAKIIVPYGCYEDGTFKNNKPAAVWGNFLTIGCDDVYLEYVTPVFNNIETNKNLFLNAISVIFNKSFHIGYTQEINLPSENTHLANLIQGISYDTFIIDNCTIGGEGLLLTGYSSEHLTEDPKVNPPEQSNLIENKTIMINKYGTLNITVFNDNVLGSTKGLSNNILVGVSNIN